MHRRRMVALLGILSITLVTGPILGSVALAADPVVTVQAGDTLTSISKRHDVEIGTLVELNNLADPNRIYAGQRLRISAPVVPVPAAQPSGPAVAGPRVHTVKPGEHLTRIARTYGVMIGAITAANGITDPSRIYAGQRLTIPGAAAAPAPKPTMAAPAAPAAPRVHTVKPGEHLTRIARTYGVTIGAITAANGIADPSRIYAGQRLTIPGAAAAAPAPAPASAMPASMAALVAKRDAVRRVIVEEAQRYGVPPAFALAVAWQESGWQQGVVSHAGAVGVMQLMPATAEWVGTAMLGTPVQINDMRSNVRAGVRLLSHYLNRYSGDRARVLAAYYQGQWATDHHGIYPVSRPYIASIVELERIFSR